MKNLMGQLQECGRVFLTTHDGSQGLVVIVFKHPVNFNPKQYPELKRLGTWKVSNDMCRYFLTCTTKESPLPIIRKVLSNSDLNGYKLKYGNSRYGSLYDL